jgi:hypothetical protein
VNEDGAVEGVAEGFGGQTNGGELPQFFVYEPEPVSGGPTVAESAD